MSNNRLRDYVQHKPSCMTRQFWAGRIDVADTSQCTCGLAALLAERPEGEAEARKLLDNYHYAANHMTDEK